jgi:hypothetical protein
MNDLHFAGRYQSLQNEHPVGNICGGTTLHTVRIFPLEDGGRMFARNQEEPRKTRSELDHDVRREMF